MPINHNLETELAALLAQRQRSNSLYVDTVNGDDSNPLDGGYLTISAALAAASPGDTVFGPVGSHTESFSVPADVKLVAPGLQLTVDTSPGILLADGSSVYIDDLAVGDGKIGVLVSAANAKAHARVETMTVGSVGGTAAYGAGNTASGGVLVINCNRIYVGDNSYGCGDATTSNGHIDLHVLNIYGLSGAGAGFGIGAFGGKLTGVIGHITDAGGQLTAVNAAGGEINVVTTEIKTTTGILTSGTGSVRAKTSLLECTNGFISTGTGTSFIAADEVNCTAAYNVGSGTTLNMLCQTLSGTKTASGTVNEFKSTAFGKTLIGGPYIFPGPTLAGNDIDQVVRVQTGMEINAIEMVKIGPTNWTTAGTFVLTAKRAIDGSGNNMLSGASEDLTALTAEVESSATLTGTIADLQFAASGYFLLNVASDNGDLSPVTDDDALMVSVYGDPI